MYKIINHLLEENSGTFEEKSRDDSILVNLTYIGKNSKENSGIFLVRTFEKARRNNERSNITSALAINDDYFIQNLEGSRYDINKFLARVINERPHLLLQVINVEEIASRRWDGFLIKYLTSKAQDEENMLMSFSAGADFNPYLMSQTQIANFMTSVFEKNAFDADSRAVISKLSESESKI
ncbi:BLUF domain-containing protein [Psychrobacter sp. B38]|uniref:BLUF domain-containing protein n=1 Tax=Psychrobacter sp. B38 TaxID=3143538 RepID=UPI00321120B3